MREHIRVRALTESIFTLKLWGIPKEEIKDMMLTKTQGWGKISIEIQFKRHLYVK